MIGQPKGLRQWEINPLSRSETRDCSVSLPIVNLSLAVGEWNMQPDRWDRKTWCGDNMMKH